MPESFRLYDLSDSPFCLKSRICLNLKQVPYERVTLTFARLRELRRLNPLGKVPVLVTAADVVPDSSTIARVLEESFPTPALLPGDADARAYCQLIEEWADESLYFIIGAFKWLNGRNRAIAYASAAEMASGLIPARLAGPLVRRSVARRYRAWGYTEKALPHLEVRMGQNLQCFARLLGERPFLLGNFVTIGDIAVYAQLAWMRRYAEGALLHKAPAVSRWMGRLDAVEEIRDALPAAPPA